MLVLDLERLQAKYQNMSVTITHTSSHKRLIDICLAAVAKAEARTFLSWERVGYSRLTVPRAAFCCGGYAAALGGDAAAHAPCAPGELHAGGGSTAAASASIVASSHAILPVLGCSLTQVLLQLEHGVLEVLLRNKLGSTVSASAWVRTRRRSGGGSTCSAALRSRCLQKLYPDRARASRAAPTPASVGCCAAAQLQ